MSEIDRLLREIGRLHMELLDAQTAPRRSGRVYECKSGLTASEIMALSTDE